jgi:hypothetical protein
LKELIQEKLRDDVSCFLATPSLIQTPVGYRRDSNIISKNRIFHDPRMQNVAKQKACENLRQNNIPFLYVSPSCHFKFNIIHLLWYNPLSHFILRNHRNDIILELFRNNKNDPVTWYE